MRIPRLYTAQALTAHQGIVLEQGPSHHVLRVLRLRPGDPVVVFNGNGEEFPAIVEGADGKLARLQTGEPVAPRRESPLHISLGQGISRGERMDLVVQKAVELGVHSLTPLWTRRSQVQLQGPRLDKRLSHWRGVIQAACEQSGRVCVPELNAPLGLDNWLQSPGDSRNAIVLDPQADMTLRDVEPRGAVRVLIGPEGGLEEEEVKSAAAAGYQRIRLGPRILRTETAALAVLAALQVLWGDFSG